MSSKPYGMRDEMGITGILELDLVDDDGNVLRTMRDRNLIVDTGLALIAAALGDDDSPPGPNRVAVGTNGAAAAAGDVVPLAEQWTGELDSIDHPTPRSVRFNFTVPADQCNGMTLREFGLVRDDGETQVLFSRKGEKSIEKTSAFAIVGRWTITIN